MADHAGDKTEPPTPRRRSEARSSGQVAKSQELNAAVLLLTAMITLSLFGWDIWHTMIRITRQSLGGEESVTSENVLNLAARSLLEASKSVAPLFIIIFIVGVAVVFAQVGFLFTLKPMTPKLDKLNPLNGFKRLASAHTVVQLFQNLAKLALISLVVWLSVRAVIDEVMLAHTVDFAVTFALAAGILFRVGMHLVIVLLLLAFIDYAYQRYRHEKQLKMTKEEVKEEMKRMDGDPVIKRRRREAQLRLAAQRLKSTVPTADVVVTNPTHYAVALQYKPDEMEAPKVVAKGVDFLAQRIRELAMEHGIPIIQKPALARRLYEGVEVGHSIPERFYRAVAEILAYVYELGGRRFLSTTAGVG